MTWFILSYFWPLALVLWPKKHPQNGIKFSFQHDWRVGIIELFSSSSMWNDKRYSDGVRAGPSTNPQSPLIPWVTIGSYLSSQSHDVRISRNYLHTAFLGFSGTVYVMDQTECLVRNRCSIDVIFVFGFQDLIWMCRVSNASRWFAPGSVTPESY